MEILWYNIVTTTGEHPEKRKEVLTMTYRVCYESKRKDAARHVYCYGKRPVVYPTIEFARTCPMFNNKHYNVYIVAVTKEGWRRV